MRSLVVGAILALSSSSMVMAQSGPTCVLVQGCQCAAEVPASGPVAQLTSIAGNIILSTAAGKLPVQKDPTGVELNDQIDVGAGGSAVLKFGPSCQLNLAGPQQITVKVSEGCACASTAGAGAGAGAGALAALLLATGGGVAAALFAAGGGGGSGPASP